LVQYIKDNIFGDETEMSLVEKRGIIDDLYQKYLKEKVEKILAKLKELRGMTEAAYQKIKAKIDEILKSGKFQALVKFIKDLISKYYPQSDALPMTIDMPKTCEDLLSAETCAKIKEMAAKMGLKAEEVMAAIKKAVESGVTDAKELYAKIVLYLRELSCEKVLGEARCAKIKEIAAKLGLKAEEVMAAVKKAIESGVTDAKELYAKIVQYLSELTCEKVLGQTKCDYLRKLADIISVNFDKVVLKLKEYYEKGVTTATELFNKLVQYIKDNIFGDETEMSLVEKRGIIDIYKYLKEKIAKILDKLRNLPGITEEVLKNIQAKVDAFIKSGKIQALAKYIKSIIDQYFPQ